MSITLVQTHRMTTPRVTSLEFAVVCLFSLMGLTLTAAVLPFLSDEMIGMMFSCIGWN
jgi:hypothetical protein